MELEKKHKVEEEMSKIKRGKKGLEIVKVRGTKVLFSLQFRLSCS
jgi:hypothetical protein